jgi:hypothetical protein
MADARQDLSIRHSGIAHQAVPSGIFIDPVLKATDRNVLCVMRTQMSQDSKLVMPTYREIKRMANIGSDATVSRALSILRLTRWIVRAEVLRDLGGRIIRVVYDVCDEPECLQTVIAQDTSYLGFVETSQSHNHPAVAHAARMAQGGIDQFMDEVSMGHRAVRSLSPTEKQEIRQRSRESLAQFQQGNAEHITYFGMSLNNKISLLDEPDDPEEETWIPDESPVQKTRLQKLKSGPENDEFGTRLQFLKSQNSQTSKTEECSSSFINTTTTAETEKRDFSDSGLFWPEILTTELNENERRLIARSLSKADSQDRQPLINQLTGRMLDRTQPEIEDPVKYMAWLIKHHLKGEEVLTSFSTRDYRQQDAPGESRHGRKNALERQLREAKSTINTLRTMMEHPSSNPALRQQLEQSLQREEALLQSLNDEMRQYAEN